jgi:hypothetical protein
MIDNSMLLLLCATVASLEGDSADHPCQSQLDDEEDENRLDAGADASGAAI